MMQKWGMPSHMPCTRPVLVLWLLHHVANATGVLLILMLAQDESGESGAKKAKLGKGRTPRPAANRLLTALSALSSGSILQQLTLQSVAAGLAGLEGRCRALVCLTQVVGRRDMRLRADALAWAF